MVSRPSGWSVHRGAAFSGASKQQFHRATGGFTTPERVVNIRIIQGGQAQGFHRLRRSAVEIPQVLLRRLVLQSGHLVGGFVGIVSSPVRYSDPECLFLFDAQQWDNSRGTVKSGSR